MIRIAFLAGVVVGAAGLLWLISRSIATEERATIELDPYLEAQLERILEAERW